MPNSSQISQYLFKKSLGKAQTIEAFNFGNEEINLKVAVSADQIWSQSGLIPNTADPSLSAIATGLGASASSGVVKYYNKLLLKTFTPVGNRSTAFYHEDLKDSIPFNFGDGTYLVKLWLNNGTTEIPFGDGDWLVDTDGGVLTFYNTGGAATSPVFASPGLTGQVNFSNPPRISFYRYIGSKGLGADSGVGTILGVTAGQGLSGGGTAGYITLDVQVDTAGLTVSGDLVRLQNTITGDRTFQDSVTVNGNLTVNGTASYVYTENLVIEDNLITLNATVSGTPTLNAGIEVNRGNETNASLIWNESTDLWSAGLSGSEVSILLNSGTGLVKNGSTVSLDFSNITGTGLTQNGSQISIDTNGFSNTLAGVGLTSSSGVLSVNVGNGLEIVSDTIYLGGTLSQNTTIDSGGFDVTIQNFDTLTLTGSAVDIIIGTGSITTDSSKGLIYSTDYSSTFVTHSLITKKYVDSGTSSIWNAIDSINNDYITGITAGVGLTGGGTAGSISISLTNTGATAGYYGNSFSYPIFSIDAQGRVTDIGTQSIDLSSGSATIAIGPPEDLAGYSDGIFTDFTPATPIGTAIDRFNEMFLLLAPTPPGSWAGSITSISFTNTPYSPRALSTGVVVNRMFTSTTPTLTSVNTVSNQANAKVDTNGFTFSLVDNGLLVGTATLSGTYTVAKVTGNIQHGASVDPYTLPTPQAGKVGFWKGIASFTLTGNLPSITPSSSQRTLELYYPNSGYVTYTYYIDSPLSTSVNSLTASIPSMTARISGVPTLTTGQNITSVGFNIPSVSSYFWAPSYVWSVAAGLVNGATGDPDSIPSTYNETGVVSGRSLVVANNQFSDTSFSFTVTPRNSIAAAGTPATLTTNFFRVDTKSVETSRITSGSGNYPSAGYGSSYLSSQSLLTSYTSELQLKNSKYVYPSVNYTNFGGDNYASCTGLRWATFNLGSITGIAAFTLTINGLVGISNKFANANFYFEIKVDGAVPSKWVDGDESYPGSGNPGSGATDGDPAFNGGYTGTSASVRRITFGTPKTGNVIVRIGWNQTLGTSVEFTSITISDLA